MEFLILIVAIAVLAIGAAGYFVVGARRKAVPPSFPPTPVDQGADEESRPPQETPRRAVDTIDAALR